MIEVLIVIVIVIIIIAITIFSYRFFERQTDLESEALNIEATIKLAQTKTLASEEATQYGVHFTANSYTLFKGAVYDPLDASNKAYQVSSRLEINNISLSGGGSDIIFNRISGATAQDGQIGIRIIAEPAKTQTIEISSTGQVQLLGAGGACCDTGRLQDSRHVHLDMGWSIQNAITLTLSFPDIPVVVEDIVMADYFDVTPNPTEFDWSGTINVNGENQTLQIHSHSLDAFNTVLCIHRDQDNNTKPLDILIDAKAIISYAVDGSIVVGPFGGVEEIQ